MNTAIITGMKYIIMLFAIAISFPPFALFFPPRESESFICPNCRSPMITGRTYILFLSRSSPRKLVLRLAREKFSYAVYNRYELSGYRPPLTTQNSAIKTGNWRSIGRQLPIGFTFWVFQMFIVS